MREPYFTFNGACAVLRGLTEYMTSSDWWVESFVEVLVDDTIVGTAQIWSPGGEGRAGPIELIGTQSSA